MKRSCFLAAAIIFASFSPLWSSGSAEKNLSSDPDFAREESGMPAENHSEFSPDMAERVRQNLTPLFEESHRVYPTEADMIFLKHYSADEIPGTASVGYFVSGEKKLAAYLFLPETDNPEGTVFLLHGYLDHTLSNRYVIEFLLEHNYAVLGFDLPGHGLSEGEAAAIDDFRDYSDALARFFKLSERLRDTVLPGPYTALAHSTGCSVIMESVSRYGNQFDKIIMVSPLVHAVGWRLTPLGVSLAKPFTDRVFRRFGGSSSNKAHEYFVQHEDPLQSRSVPFSWVNAHQEWFERMESEPVNENINLSIIQGEKDSVVDYDFNIPFLQALYPAARVYKFPEGEHSLFNEVPEIRRPVFKQILECLEKPLKP